MYVISPSEAARLRLQVRLSRSGSRLRFEINSKDFHLNFDDQRYCHLPEIKFVRLSGLFYSCRFHLYESFVISQPLLLHNPSGYAEGMKREPLEIETLVLRWTGMLPKREKDYFYKIYSYFIFSMVATSWYLDVYMILEDVENTTTFVENFTIGTALLIGSIKIAVTYHTRHKLRDSFLQLTRNNFCADDKEEQKLQDRYTSIMNIQARVCYFTPFVYMVFANTPCVHQRLTSTNSSHWILPFGAFPLFDTTTSPNYEIALIYQNLLNFVTFICYMAIVVAICGTVITLTLHCKIIQHRIKTCIKRSTGKGAPQLRRNLKEIIKYHVWLNEVAKEFTRRFSSTLLVDFCGLSIIIASCTFYVMLIQEFNFKFAQMFTLTNTAITIEFVVCYWGSELINESLAIGDTCFEIEFVGQDLHFQKMLRFIIQRARTPVALTVGGFSPLTMRTFLLVMKGAYSFFMFLGRERK
ncbi:uncharacterized protein LOC116169159 [Photinus pyralis]|uniref:uncharacterized protein LOC116169159 n=1 Tax=Photinus pyralis TaxID=7054 RepID=UPI001266F987|nr:uncharacterized protein LOC116169159 [Photinus pyralis]